MKFRITSLIILLLTSLSACQESSGELDKKMSRLKEKKAELTALQNEIEQLEAEVAALDPEFARANRKATLVSTVPVKREDFESYVEISGSVESRKNVDITAETVGTIEEIHVEKGQLIRAGQSLIKLENEILRSNLEELETNYELAKTMFERQSNLWEKKIGTEVQYLEAKNRKESLENQIKTLRAQIEKTNIKAPFTGIVDRLDAKIGMLAQPGIPLVRLVSLENMYVEAEISETYINAFKRGDEAFVRLPALDKEFVSTISAIGQVINPDNRTFTLEIKVPDLDVNIKPNLIAVVRIRDYEAENTPVVPTNLIQKDGQGYYVYIVSNSADVPVAKKVKIERGNTYKNTTEVLSGLSGGEELINEGFRDVSDGVNVKIVEATI